MAWSGLLVTVSHSLFGAWISSRINTWYGDFYNCLQRSGRDMGSGEDHQSSVEVKQQLVQFCWIVAPSLVVHPVSRYIRSRWALAWRLALVRFYISNWDPDAKSIEGASQRVQEDTSRLARSVDTGMATILSSLATLFVFAPLLVSLGENTPPPEYLAMLGKGWLLSLASATAAVHLGGAWLIGRPLVLLEVANQSCEATFRRRLVLSEALPAGAVEIEEVSKNVSIEEVINTVRINYMRLFLNFLGLNFYLSIFDQVMVLVPYIVCAPLLFAAYDRRIELGILVQISNAFGKVFGALSVVAEDVAQIQDFRSTLHRLREFETKLRHSYRQSWSSGLMPVDEMRSDEAECVVELTDQPLSKKNACQ